MLSSWIAAGAPTLWLFLAVAVSQADRSRADRSPVDKLLVSEAVLQAVVAQLESFAVAQQELLARTARPLVQALPGSLALRVDKSSALRPVPVQEPSAQQPAVLLADFVPMNTNYE